MSEQRRGGPGRPSNSIDPNTPGGRVRTARERGGWTIEGAATGLGWTRAYLYQLETGRRPLTLDTLHQIATAWGIDPAELDPRLASSTPPPPSSLPCPSTLALRVGEGGAEPAGGAESACLHQLPSGTRRAILDGATMIGRLAAGDLRSAGVGRILIDLATDPKSD